MVGTIATLAFFLSASLSLTAADGTRLCAAPDPHIRTLAPALAEAIEAGVDASPTLKSLVDRIEASDLIVYVAFDHSPVAATSGHIALVAVAGGRRYVRLAVNPRYDGWQRIAILGHELRHAVEIADAPLVVDQSSLVSHYRRIGFSNGERMWESGAAIDAGQQVHSELARSQRGHATR
jgi:hypothetical protein